MIYAAAEKVSSAVSHAAGSMADQEPFRRRWDSAISEGECPLLSFASFIFCH